MLQNENTQMPDKTENKDERTKVLLAENDEALAGAIVSIVVSDDCFELVGIAQTHQEIFEICSSRQPNLIILDKLLEEPEGPTIAEKLYELRPEARILLIGEVGDISTISNCLSEPNINICDFVLKPFERKLFLHTLHAVRDMHLNVSDVDPKKITVLTVDDEEPIQEIIASMLAAAGFKVTKASSGREAVMRCMISQPDIILMDLMMAELDGISAADMIFKLYPGIRVIMVTAVHDMSVALACLRMPNIYACLLKPFERPRLIHLVKATKARETKRLCAAFNDKEPITHQSQEAPNTDSMVSLGQLEFLLHDLRNEFALIGYGVEMLDASVGHALPDSHSPAKALKVHLQYSDYILAMLQAITSLEPLRESGQCPTKIAARLPEAIRYCVDGIYSEIDRMSSSPEAQEQTSSIRRRLEHIRLLLNTTLEMHRKLVTVEALFTEISSISKPRLPPDIQLRFGELQRPSEIFTDPSRVVNVLVQLIDNSAKALGGRRGVISVTATFRENTVQLTVKDDGGGIPESIRRKLLIGPVESTTGLGMGLYLSNRIIKELGGTMTILSGLSGTEVSIILPVME